MGSEWRETTLGEVLSLQRGFDLPAAQREPGDYPVIASTGQVGSHSTAMVRGPGVVIGRSGSLGGGQYIQTDFWPLNTTLWVRDFRGNDVRFCYYLLKSLDLARFNAGSGVPTLNRNHVHPLRVRVPTDTGEQRAIAGILGALDDKIELNRRTNETLESIARAIFKSWFVDFDPVRENMARKAGRSRQQQPLPGLAAALEAAGAATPAGVLDLFPDEFEDSELGPIPRGWRVARLDETATFLNGLALQKYPAAGGESLPAIKIAQLRKGNTEGADRVSAELPADYIIDDGDVLFSWSGSLECTLWTGGRGALNQHLFRVTSERYPKWFHYFWIHHHLAEFRRIAAGKATTMGHIQRRHLSEAKVLIPPSPELTAMSRAMSPFIDRLIGANLQSGALAGIRDTLLPKLISGELRLPDAERITRRHA